MNENMKIAKKTPNTRKKPVAKKTEGEAWKVVKGCCHYIYMLRGVIISLPVLVIAICQAFKNASRLPEMVGLNLQATGEYATMVTRSTAVVLPLLVTIGCILLTCFSKRPLFPWLISIFTLVLPILVWVINIYPA